MSLFSWKVVQTTKNVAGIASYIRWWSAWIAVDKGVRSDLAAPDLLLTLQRSCIEEKSLLKICCEGCSFLRPKRPFFS